MSISLPAGFQTWLEAQVKYFVVAYELELAAGTLYYSSQSFTWADHPDGSQNYTRLAVKTSPIKEEISVKKVPRIKLTFSNVTNTLRAHLTPTDLITNRRCTVRLLLRDAAGALLSTSLVLFKGVMQQPKKINEKTIEIDVNGLLHGFTQPIPGSRRFARPCEWVFADGVNCLYTGPSTQVNGTQSSTNDIDVDSSSLFRVGDKIAMGANTGLTVDVIPSATRLIVDQVISVNDNDDVDFEECSHEFSDCVRRERTHEYGGFRGQEDLSFNARRFVKANAALDPRWSDYDIRVEAYSRRVERLFPEPEGLDDVTVVMPILFGRRTITPHLNEKTIIFYQSATKTLACQTLVPSEGPIEDVVGMYTPEDGLVTEQTKSVGGGQGTTKVFGYWWRRGEAGVDTTMTAGFMTGSLPTNPLPQNRDYHSAIRDPLHHSAYITTVEEIDSDSLFNESGFDIDLVQAEFDIKGLRVQKYTTTTTDGSEVYSRNPIWHATELARHDRWGGGATVQFEDFDLAVINPEAAKCDVTVKGDTQTVDDTTDTELSGTFDVFEIQDTAEFMRGQGVEYSDAATTITGEVLDVLGDKTVRLDFEVETMSTAPTLRTAQERYVNNLHLTGEGKGERALEMILKSCAGYATYADGKVQFRVEDASLSPVAHFGDTNVSTGYVIEKGSFEWVIPKDSKVNRVVGDYEPQGEKNLEAVANHFIHRRTNPVSTKTVRIPGVDNYHQAWRLANLELQKARQHGTGATFIVGPIGLQLQPGDLIEVTHSVPNWSQVTKRITKKEILGLGSKNELFVKLTVEDYVAAVYSDASPPPIDGTRPNSGNPLAVLTATVLSAGKVKLTWTVPLASLPWKFNVYKSTATMAGDPKKNGTPVVKGITKLSYTYNANEDEIGSNLFFVVTGKVGPYTKVQVSNEVTVDPSDLDPTATQKSQGVNLAYGGDFNRKKTWVAAPSPTLVDVDASTSTDAPSPFDDGVYANPGNAFDNDSSSYAEANITSGTVQSYGTIWSFPTGGTVTGRLKVVAQRIRTLDLLSNQQLWYSSDGGANYIKMGSVGSSKRTFYSEFFTADQDDIRLRASTFKFLLGTIKGRIFEIDFEKESGSGPVAFIGSNKGSLRGDGASSYASFTRQFPGQGPSTDKAIASGQEWVVHLECKQGGDGALTDPVEVRLHNVSDDTWVNILVVAGADIDATWNSHCNRWTAPQAYDGPFEIQVRTVSDKLVNVDKLQVNIGDMIWAFDVNTDEVTVEPDYSEGKRGAYPAGQWTGTPLSQVKKAAVA